MQQDKKKLNKIQINYKRGKQLDRGGERERERERGREREREHAFQFPKTNANKSRD